MEEEELKKHIQEMKTHVGCLFEGRLTRLVILHFEEQLKKKDEKINILTIMGEDE